MRSIYTQGKGRVFFDVLRFQFGRIEPVTLTPGARKDLARALGKSPSDTFIGEVEKALASYRWDRGRVSDATPKKVRVRITEVKKKIEALYDAIDNLQESDWHLIDLAVKRERLKNRHTISGNKMIGLLRLYCRHVAEAEMRITRAMLKGRMPAYAEESFATRIAALLQAETGERPTSTRARKKEHNEGAPDRGSIFTQVLTILLNSVPTDSRKLRKDVEALARRALKSLPSGDG